MPLFMCIVKGRWKTVVFGCLTVSIFVYLCVGEFLFPYFMIKFEFLMMNDDGETNATWRTFASRSGPSNF